MKNISKRHAEEAWENGELGTSEAHVRKVSTEREMVVDKASGLLRSLDDYKETYDLIKNASVQLKTGHRTQNVQFKYLCHIIELVNAGLIK